MNVIFGSGGHAKEIYQLVKTSGNLNIDFFVDIEKTNTHINGIKVILEKDFFDINPVHVKNIFLGIGNSLVRSEIYQRLRNSGFDNSVFANLIHPSIQFDSDDKIKLGFGCVINKGCIFTTEINIGNFVHVNINSTISHECIIGDFTTISPGCCICGNVVLGERVFLGAHSTIIEKITVCNSSIIGAGAVVVRDITEKATYCGVPAKRVR